MGQMAGGRCSCCRWWEKGRGKPPQRADKSHLETAAHTDSHPERRTGRLTGGRDKEESAPQASRTRQIGQRSPGSLTRKHPAFKELTLALHTIWRMSTHCFRCPWRPPKPCSSACCSWWSLKAGVSRRPSQAATCTVSHPGSRGLGGSRADGLDRGRQHPRWTHGGNRQWELGEPAQRHRLPLACLLLSLQRDGAQ